MWRIPKASAAFVAAMEDVLEVYQRPYNEKQPVVRLNETNRQLYRRNQNTAPSISRAAPLPPLPRQ
jgi:rRNA pseudouridine-1189 N-methylase Emg1 (Nep1/Mra1 family)